MSLELAVDRAAPGEPGPLGYMTGYCGPCIMGCAIIVYGGRAYITICDGDPAWHIVTS